MQQPIQIAIDGPAGAGKSTIARILAQRLGILYLDTGAMYRAVGLKAHLLGINTSDEEGLAQMIRSTQIQVLLEEGGNDQQILLDGSNVSREIRTPEASQYASDVSRYAAVREKLVFWQREIAENGSVVMDGRDIGTHVLPQAKYKFFLTASAEERARRRCAQLEEKEMACNYEDILTQIKARDCQDMNRPVSPLRQAKDAICIDCTHMAIDDVLHSILSIIESEYKV